MIKDLQGHALSGATADAAAAYEGAVQAFNLFQGDPMALLEQAIEAAPRFVMAHVFKAHLLNLSTEPAAVAQARAIVAEVKAMPLNDRETAHVAALGHLVAGNWTAGAVALDHHSMRFPHDLVALQVGHQADFFRANARNLRDRIARALPAWSSDIPGHSILFGMYAFGLEECGDYARAEEAGRQAVALQPLDCWAHHAVAHVMEMQGRAEDGIGWMVSREPYWSGDANFFKVHNWWHRALCHLDLGQIDQVLALYDGPIRKDRSAVAVDLIDATALLWRLHLSGHDVGDRWGELATAWDDHADATTYPFNDWHAVMAYLGAGRLKDVARIARIYHEGAATGREADAWGRATARPLVEGFNAFWHGDHRTAVELLHGARFIANGFGGSHAQRDIIDWTLIEAALRGGLPEVAEALAHERLATKPRSPVNLAFLARSQRSSNAHPKAA
ncbi:tetratricopeptide repeat protein [Reyranella sp.]|uniref:tetratricopeptide repeat protein n=1 Tax=Reyranella sp. TaxID=1929291 RepID=UPI003BAB5714